VASWGLRARVSMSRAGQHILFLLNITTTTTV
jgi:hypothetical protein